MTYTLSFSNSEKALDQFLSISSAFSHTYGMSLLLFPSYQKLALFPTAKIEPSNSDNPWTSLNNQLASSLAAQDWLGYLSYEMGSASYEKNAPPTHLSCYPLYTFFQHALTFTLFENEIDISIDFKDLHSLLNPNDFDPKFSNRDFWESFSYESNSNETHFFTEFTKESEKSFADKVLEAQNAMKRGDLYQINLSQSLKASFEGDSFSLFTQLYKNHPAPFSAYFNLGSFQVVSLSPERFLKHKNNRLETRPIKGTCPVSCNNLKDQESQQNLFRSTKEKAELSMVIDLMRNDLGRISKVGSIRCLEKRKALKLSTLHHIEAVIESVPLPLSASEMLKKTFPPGSVTGCPKKKVLEVIDQLEDRPRHLYCGAIGYLNSNQEFDFSVSIRTAVVHNGEIELQVGSGLTIDSIAHQEYQETLDKAHAFELCLAATPLVLKG